MRKKSITCFTIILFFCFSLIGCNYKYKKFPFNEEKPNKFYYTNALIKDFVFQKPKKISVLYMNFYKDKIFNNEDTETMANFLNSLKKEYFIEKPANMPEKPVYKVFMNFDNERYVINVYDKKYVSIHPWDGKYSMDYIDISKVHTAYNLYGLCKYLIPK